MMKENEKTKKASELAKEIAKLDSDILSVEIIDEPGQIVAGYSKVGGQEEKSSLKDVWRSVSFQQALFFSSKREASSEEVVVIDKNEYTILLRAPEAGIMVMATAVNLTKSVGDILKLVEAIRRLVDSFSNH